jgi:hypothetical protein
VNIVSETIKNTQITKVPNRTDSLSPARALPERGRAMHSRVTKIAHARRKKKKFDEIPARLKTNTVTAAIAQTPRMLRSARSFSLARNG